MSDDDSIPCPKWMSETSWVDLLADLEAIANDESGTASLTPSEAEHTLKALRFYAEHAGKPPVAPEPAKPPWRNRYVRPEGANQHDWDLCIKNYECTSRRSGERDALARHILAHLPIIPEEWPIRRIVSGNLGVTIESDGGSMTILWIERNRNPLASIAIQHARALADTIVKVMDEYERRKT